MPVIYDASKYYIYKIFDAKSLWVYHVHVYTMFDQGLYQSSKTTSLHFENIVGLLWV